MEKSAPPLANPLPRAPHRNGAGDEQHDDENGVVLALSGWFAEMVRLIPKETRRQVRKTIRKAVQRHGPEIATAIVTGVVTSLLTATTEKKKKKKKKKK
jgi:hypothetical protein